MRYMMFLLTVTAACGGRVEIVSDTPGPPGENGDVGRPGTDGAVGAAGTNGTNGVAGTNGTDGVKGQDGAFDTSRLYTKTGTMTLWSSGSMGVPCDGEDKIITGGCRIVGVGRDAWLTVNEPQGNGRGWICSAWKQPPSTLDVGPQIVTATAICYRGEEK